MGAKIAGELGVRVADEHYAHNALVRRSLADGCTLEMEDSIIARHHVARRVRRSFATDDRAMALFSIVALTLLIALVGLGLAQFWAMAVESWFLRDAHVSYRAFQAPAIAHG